MKTSLFVLLNVVSLECNLNSWLSEQVLVELFIFEQICLRSYEEEFVEVLQRCTGVVVARCSPTQKAQVARLLRARKKVVAAVGDGGNDVAMIQEADMGESNKMITFVVP